jgi:hypothetical protein
VFAAVTALTVEMGFPDFVAACPRPPLAIGRSRQ